MSKGKLGLAGLRFWRLLPIFALVLCVGDALADQPNIIWMRAGASQIGAMAYTSDGTTLVTEDDNALRVWRVSDGTLLKTVIVPGQYIGSVSLTPDGQYAAVTINPSGARTGPFSISLVRLSDATVLSAINISAASPTGTYSNFVLSPDATLLAVGTSTGQEGYSGGRVLIFNLTSGTQVNSFPAAGVTVASCSSCSFYPIAFQGDNRMVVEGANTGSGLYVFYLWEPIPTARR